jgi:hypothetical protein
LHPTITYNAHVIAIFCSLHSFGLKIINLKVYALQKCLEKAWQQKGTKKTYHWKIEVQKLNVESQQESLG